MITASQWRYSDDDPELYGLRPVERTSITELHSRALSQNVRVSERVLPAVHAAVACAKNALDVARPVSGFVFSSPDTNAFCHAGTDDGPVLVLVSSGLVKLVSPIELRFVLGHELGHFVFGHFAYPSAGDSRDSLRLLELQRASEISADRAGLLACRDVDVALAAILKVASGLDEAHLHINVLDYIRQVRELGETTGDESLLYSTHPSFPLRARALLRFDSVLQQESDGTSLAQLLEELDARIRREMDRAAAGSAGNRFTDQAMTAAFWRAAYTLCADGSFGGDEQQRLANRFGGEKVDALKRLLSTRSKSEGLLFLQEKQREAEDALNAAPLFVVRAAKEALRGFRA